MPSFDTLQTPALLLSEPALTRNLAAMGDRARAAGVDLRPHCKTHKSAEIARRATDGFSGAITVSTLAEAEYFAEEGFTDMTYAVGLAPAKLARVDAIQARGATVGLLVDNVPAAQAVVEASRNAPNPYRVWIEIDSGYHRGGVLPDHHTLLDVAKRLVGADAVEFAGVLAHAGHSYSATTTLEIQAIGVDERNAVVRAAECLERDGIACPRRSVGSTPTAVHGPKLDGITEIRPGVYAVFDLTMQALGVCDYRDIAATVLGTVIGHQPEHGHILVDAGAFALSRDVGTRREGRAYGKYGLVRRPDANEPYEDLEVFAVSQEHGWIRHADPNAAFPFDAFPIGSRVRILPHHACETLRCHEVYHVLNDDGHVVADWDHCRGW